MWTCPLECCSLYFATFSCNKKAPKTVALPFFLFRTEGNHRSSEKNITDLDRESRRRYRSNQIIKAICDIFSSHEKFANLLRVTWNCFHWRQDGFKNGVSFTHQQINKRDIREGKTETCRAAISHELIKRKIRWITQQKRK